MRIDVLFREIISKLLQILRSSKDVRVTVIAFALEVRHPSQSAWENKDPYDHRWLLQRLIFEALVVELCKSYCNCVVTSKTPLCPLLEQPLHMLNMIIVGPLPDPRFNSADLKGRTITSELTIPKHPSLASPILKLNPAQFHWLGERQMLQFCY